MSPPKNRASPPKNEAPPPKKESSPPKQECSAPLKETPLPKKLSPPPKKEQTPPKKESSPLTEPSRPKKEPAPPRKESLPVVSPPKREAATPPTPVPKAIDVKSENSVAALASRIEAASPPKKEVTSPPFKINRNNSKAEDKEVASPPFKVNRNNSKTDEKEVTSPPFKINRNNSKTEENGKTIKREDSIGHKVPPKDEKLSLVGGPSGTDENKNSNNEQSVAKKDGEDNKSKNEESNGVGDKIKKFEKAAEESASTGKLSRANSMKGRSRIGSDNEFLPPATPFKDNGHFELPPPEKADIPHPPERQQSFNKNNPLPPIPKWARNDSHEEKIQKPEPLKIIKPEFKPMPSPVDVTIRSPSLGGKAASAVQFHSHGTAFRNVASPDTARAAPQTPHKFNEDINTQSNFKQCKAKPKKEYQISKGSSYFTRGSEEIWLVKKADIEEIEERVFDSFRRAGGNVCMRSESMRPSSDSGQSSAFTHATMGRNKRQMYARSESLDPQWASGRAHTLKRQTSVACTCGHDKKTRPKTSTTPETVRPRSRSHGDENQSHVLDKYETLV